MDIFHVSSIYNVTFLPPEHQLRSGNLKSWYGRINQRVFRRGGGNASNRQNKFLGEATNPLLREVDVSPKRARGRGRGKGGRARLAVTRGRGTGTGRGRGSGRGRVSVKGSLRGRGGIVKQNGTVGLVSLNRRRQQAIESLLKAKQTLAKLNNRQRQQKVNRSLVVNQRRGLQSSTSNLSTAGRGRGTRGRGRGLSRYSSSTSLASVGGAQRRGGGRGRGLNRALLSGSTVSLNSNTSPKQQNQRRRYDTFIYLLTVFGLVHSISPFLKKKMNGSIILKVNNQF
ncbi:hypothetical protein ACF0H5_020401 [Mactra antiquata]